MEREIVLSGIRATGRLHLGNYMGALIRFARMSLEEGLQCFFFVADMHTLTTLKEAKDIRSNMPEIILDYLAAGVDPNRSAIYVQSHIPQVAELMWYLSCLTPVSELLNQGAYKEKAAKAPEDNNTGLLSYPVLMAADILGPRANLVPVGRDQAAHLELARDLARRFNNLSGESYFPIPDSLLQEMVQVPGLYMKDERGGFPKMGKSDDESHTIYITDTAEATQEKIRVAPTDPKRVRRSDPGTPEDCAIYALHQLVSTGKEIAEVAEGCRTAGIGCIECKEKLSGNVNVMLADFRERRSALASNKRIVGEVLEVGRQAAAPRFDETLEVVRSTLGLR